MPCRARAAISVSGVGGQSAQGRGNREPDDSDQEDATSTQPVTQRPAEQDQAGQGQEVGVADPLELGE